MREWSYKYDDLPPNIVAGIFENLLGFNADFAPLLVSKTPIMKWILNRIQSKAHVENKGYAAELLSILLQNNRANRLELGNQDGVDAILKVLSVNDRCLVLSTVN